MFRKHALVYLTVGFLLLVNIRTSTGFFFKHEVCYKGLGCFSKDGPYSGSFVELPSSPTDIQTRTFLWTRNNPVVPQEIDYLHPATIARSNFDPDRPTKVMIHGFHAKKETTPIIANLTGPFLQQGDYNVIGVDWSKGANHFYPKAAANARVVGAVVANLITTLRKQFDLDIGKLHILGHSLGAHAAGFIGARIPGIARITGLDPAGPMYVHADPAARLDPTDARFVDVIHSDGAPLHNAGFGTLKPLGDQDYYPNGGQIQPGCPPPVSTTLKELVTFKFKTAFNDVSCAHGRAVWYFIESVVHAECRFTSYPCASWAEFQRGVCMSCGPGTNATCPQMGINAVQFAVQGSFYLRTGATTPFCGLSCRYWYYPGKPVAEISAGMEDL